MKLSILENGKNLIANVYLSEEERVHLASKLNGHTIRLVCNGRLPSLCISASHTEGSALFKKGGFWVFTISPAKIGAVSRKESISAVATVHEWTDGVDPWPVLRVAQVPDRFWRDSAQSLPPASRALQRSVGENAADIATAVALLNDAMKSADKSYFLELDGTRRVRLMQEQVVRKQIV